MKCACCNGTGYVSGGKVTEDWHVPAQCYSCLGTGTVRSEGKPEMRPRLPLEQETRLFWSLP